VLYFNGLYIAAGNWHTRRWSLLPVSFPRLPVPLPVGSGIRKYPCPRVKLPT
jgi:hypothetical protein